MHGLNDTQMLAEIISEVTKAKHNINKISGQVLAWAKGVEAQRVQLGSLTA